MSSPHSLLFRFDARAKNTTRRMAQVASDTFGIVKPTADIGKDVPATIK
jgi:hypothetical protein